MRWVPKYRSDAGIARRHGIVNPDERKGLSGSGRERQNE